MNTLDGIIINDESTIDCKYALTRHVQERYAERIMSNEDLNYNLFISQHQEKIKVDVNKMIYYGQLICNNSPTRDGKLADIYLNGCWIIVVNEKEKKAITLYKIDLGLGDSFNKDYIQKVKDKLKILEDKRSELQEAQNNKNSEYLKQIETNTSIINDYKKKIKQIESENENLKALVENESGELININNQITETVTKLVRG